MRLLIDDLNFTLLHCRKIKSILTIVRYLNSVKTFKIVTKVFFVLKLPGIFSSIFYIFKLGGLTCSTYTKNMVLRAHAKRAECGSFPLQGEKVSPRLENYALERKIYVCATYFATQDVLFFFLQHNI